MDLNKYVPIIVLFLLMNLSTCFTLFAYVSAFILGFCAVLVWSYPTDERNINLLEVKPYSFSTRLGGIILSLYKPKPKLKIEKRMTESSLIDGLLNQIFITLEKQYVIPWYESISANDEFLKESIPIIIQSITMNLSSRIKSANWTAYLTANLIEDLINHLRLYKQANAKMIFTNDSGRKKEDGNQKYTSRNNSKRPSKSTKVSFHRRNKSETDIYWTLDMEDSKQISNSKFYTGRDSKTFSNLESHFFDLEFFMEKKLLCREQACGNQTKEIDVLSEIAEVLLYVLLPPKEYSTDSLRTLFVSMAVSNVLKPLMDMFSDPDYINRMIISMCCKDTGLTTDVFLSVLRSTDDVRELQATHEMVLKEMQYLNSHNMGGEIDRRIRQQLSSLQYLARVLKSQIASVTPATVLSKETLNQISTNQNLPSECNQRTIMLLSAIDMWKLSAQKKIVSASDKSRAMANAHEYLKNTALILCNQYLSSTPLPTGVTENMVNILYTKIKYYNSKCDAQDSPLTWFDEIQLRISEVLQEDQAFLNYLWDMPQDIKEIRAENQERRRQPEKLAAVKTAFVHTRSANPGMQSPGADESLYKHARSRSDVANSSLLIDSKSKDINIPKPVNISNNGIHQDSFKLSACIIETGVVQEKGRSYGVYAVEVTKIYSSGRRECWHVYRRYSDFHDLHSIVKETWPELSSLSFPAKKAFQNTSRSLLERRMIALNDYLAALKMLGARGDPRYKALLGQQGPLADFLKQKGPSDRSISTTERVIDAIIVNPIKVSMQTLKSVPDQLANTVDEVMEGISKVFQGSKSNAEKESNFYNAVKIEVNTDTQGTSPARALLRLAEEVLGLKARHLWLRRRLVALLETLLSDRANKKILKYISTVTSLKNIAKYLEYFKLQMTPQKLSNTQSERDQETCARTRVAAKTALLSSSSDEVKRLIGAETLRLGLTTVFQALQRPMLNRRLLYVIIEGIFATLFPEYNHVDLFRRLHACAKRPNVD